MNDSDHQISRRSFVLQGGKALALVAAANTGVYVVGSAFKELDGSLVAGAKCSPATKPSCPATKESYCCPEPEPGYWTPCMDYNPC